VVVEVSLASVLPLRTWNVFVLISANVMRAE
jgi:hypothetical protein